MICKYPKCKYEDDITYMGKELCNDHWEQLSNLNGNKEQKFLLILGLMRNKDKEVVRFTAKRWQELKDYQAEPKEKPSEEPCESSV